MKSVSVLFLFLPVLAMACPSLSGQYHLADGPIAIVQNGCDSISLSMLPNLSASPIDLQLNGVQKPVGDALTLSAQINDSILVITADYASGSLAGDYSTEQFSKAESGDLQILYTVYDGLGHALESQQYTARKDLSPARPGIPMAGSGPTCSPPHCPEPTQVCGRVHKIQSCGVGPLGEHCLEQDYVGDYVLYANGEDPLDKYNLERSTIQQIGQLPEGASVCVSGDGLIGYTGNQRVLYPTKIITGDARAPRSPDPWETSRLLGY